MKKYYVYCTPCVGSSEPIYTILSEDAILAEFWHYWKLRATKMGYFNPDEQEQMQQECIEDFCIEHWATELTTKMLYEWMLEISPIEFKPKP